MSYAVQDNEYRGMVMESPGGACNTPGRGTTGISGVLEYLSTHLNNPTGMCLPTGRNRP